MNRPWSTFRISFGDGCPHEPFLVEAATYSEAAAKAAQKLFKSMKKRNTHRISGDPDKSGWFQVYTGMGPHGGENRTGWPFHVAPCQ